MSTDDHEDGSKLFWHEGIFVVLNYKYEVVKAFPVSKQGKAKKIMTEKTKGFNSEQEIVEWFWR